MEPFDLVVVGGGHNGLVTAAYAARAGQRTLVLESLDRVGGASGGDEPWPGFRVSTAAYVVSLFRPEIVRDLELARHGYAVCRGPVLVHAAARRPLAPARPRSGLEPARDREVLPPRRRALPALRGAARPDRPRHRADPARDPARSLLAPAPAICWRLARTGWRFLRLGQDGPRALEILLGAARPILERWFESEPLKATLATDAMIGALASPSTPGTAYVLFHHVMGEVNGARGVWGYVRGGMGALAGALAAAARAAGAEVRTGARVAQIRLRDGRADGVVLADGTEMPRAGWPRRLTRGARCSAWWAPSTSRRRWPRRSARSTSRARRSRSTSRSPPCRASWLPRTATRPARTTAAPSTSRPRSITSSVPSPTRWPAAPPSEPILECTIPSAVDPSVAPPGRHLMSMFVQYAPYRLAEGSWDERKEPFADRCVALLDRYAPGFGASVLHREVLSPLDLERRFGLTGGNIFQGAMTPSQLFSMRPLPGHADYRTPIPRLYLCGAATHPGGGVMGACGHNAAREILRDARRGR